MSEAPTSNGTVFAVVLLRFFGSLLSGAPRS
jgi:hypothetical protein